MQTEVSAKALQMIIDDPKLYNEAKVNPEKVLKDTLEKAEKELHLPIYHFDIVLYRIAVIVLGLLAIFAAVGSIVLVSFDKTTPDVLIALGSAAVGALVGLFAPSPSAGTTEK